MTEAEKPALADDIERQIAWRVEHPDGHGKPVDWIPLIVAPDAANEILSALRSRVPSEEEIARAIASAWEETCDEGFPMYDREAEAIARAVLQLLTGSPSHPGPVDAPGRGQFVDREVIGKAIHRVLKAEDPDWPIGVNRLGYHQEPYVKHVPAWEWFYGATADAVLAALPPPEAPQGEGIYIASRASVPERSAMWRRFRDEGALIISTWIDEAGEGETADFGELWSRITREIAGCARLVLYAEHNDFPLKGALIEAGIAIGMGKPVTISLPGVELDGRTLKPIGSWLAHPLVQRNDDIHSALLPDSPKDRG